MHVHQGLHRCCRRLIKNPFHRDLQESHGLLYTRGIEDAAGSHDPGQHLLFPPRISKELADGLCKFLTFFLFSYADALPDAGTRLPLSPVWGVLFELLAGMGLELRLL